MSQGSFALQKSLRYARQNALQKNSPVTLKRDPRTQSHLSVALQERRNRCLLFHRQHVQLSKKKGGGKERGGQEVGYAGAEEEKTREKKRRGGSNMRESREKMEFSVGRVDVDAPGSHA